MTTPAGRSVRLTRPLDLTATLAPLSRGGAGDPSIAFSPGEVWRATRNSEGVATVRYRRDGATAEVTAWGPGAEVELERAPAVLGQDDDDSGFAPGHPLLRDLHRRFAGLRLTRTGAVFEALVPAVFGQKVIGLEARRGYRRMVRELGEPAPGPVPLVVPPSAATLARTPYWAFHPFALEQRRATTLIIAASRGDWLERLASLPPESARALLTALPGIGAWTAALVTGSALGDPDAVPVGDYNLPNLVSWALAGEPRGDDARMLELLEPYHGHRGRAIRLLEAGGARPPRRGPRLAFRHLERA